MPGLGASPRRPVVDSIVLGASLAGFADRLAGLRVSAEDFLAAVLETAAQPIWSSILTA